MLSEEESRMRATEKQKKNRDTHNEWHRLIERYFDALTTPAEEQRLKRFLASPHSDYPEYDEIKAVLGYLSTGKRYHTPREQNKRIININQVLKWGTAAAIAIGIFGTATWNINKETEDICIAYIDGKKYTDSKFVIQQMHNTMHRISSVGEQESVEQQLSNIFRTMSEYNNNR